MTATTIWSWIVTVVGLVGFLLAGKKIWWAWYVNIGCQALWVTFALVSHIYAFLLSAAFYTAVFTKNAITWTKEHNHELRVKDMNAWREMTEYAEADVQATARMYGDDYIRVPAIEDLEKVERVLFKEGPSFGELYLQPNRPVNNSTCGAIDPDSGAVCHVKNRESWQHGPMHQGWAHYPGQLRSWPVEEIRVDRTSLNEPPQQRLPSSES